MTVDALSPNGHRRPVPASPAAAALLAAGVGLAGAALLVHPGVTAAPPGPILVAGGGLALLAAVLSPWLPAGRALAGTVVAWLALVAWGAASTPGSLDPYLSRVALLGWLGGVAVLAAVGLGTPVSRLWRAGAGALVVAAVALSLWALQQEVPQILKALSVGDELPRLKGTFTNADCFSAVLVGALLLASGLAATAPPPVAFTMMGCSGVLLAALLLTGSRAGVAGAAVGYLAYGALLLSRRDEEGTRGAVLGLAAPVLLGLLLLMGNLVVPALGRWGLLVSEEGRQGIDMRLAVVRDGARCVVDRPLRGSGPGTFHLAFQDHRPPGIRLYVNVAHNDYMQVAVETGLPGLALWLAGLALALGHAASGARGGPFPAEAAAAAGGIAGMGIYALLNFALPVPADFFWWCALLGLGLSDSLSRERPRPFPRLAVAPVALLLALGGLAVLALGLRMEGAARLAAESDRLARKLRWEEAATAARAALAAEPDNPAHRVRLAGLEERQARYSGRREGLKEALDLVRAAQALSPADVPLRLELARLLRETGDPQAAERLLLDTRDAAPNDLRIQAMLADVYLRRGQFPEACEALWQAGAISPNVIRPLSGLVAFMEERAEGDGTALVRRWASSPERRAEALSLAREASGSLSRAGKPEPADRFLALLAELDPDDACVLKDRAELALLQRKRPDEALRWFEKAMALEGEGEENAACRQQALARWTALMIQEGRTGPVEERLRTTLALSPWDSATRILLVDVLESRSDAAGARKLLREGLSRTPGDATLLARLGRLNESQGAWDEAMQCYRDALRREPDNAEVANLLKALEARQAQR